MLRTTTTCRGYFKIPESSEYPSTRIANLELRLQHVTPSLLLNATTLARQAGHDGIEGFPWPVLVVRWARLAAAQPIGHTPLRPSFLNAQISCPKKTTLTTGHRQCPEATEHVAEQPAVQMPLGQEQPVIPRVLDQTPAGLHPSVFEARQRAAFDSARQP